jgi:dephospho-CoA kinase
LIQIGLTGGIGSGKSWVADYLATQSGICVVDTDQIAHSLTQEHGLAMPAIFAMVQEGGFPLTWVADGKLNRPRVRDDCFSHPALRQRLEAILHPLIRVLVQQRISKAQQEGNKIAVIVVPLLVERGTWLSLVDQVWVVDSSVEDQKQRVLARSKAAGNTMTEEIFWQIIEAQASREERLVHADVVLMNDQHFEHLKTQVDSHLLPLLS